MKWRISPKKIIRKTTGKKGPYTRPKGEESTSALGKAVDRANKKARDKRKRMERDRLLERRK